jgi:ribosomal protein S18 acetylase RimI-like enzyme
MTDVHVFRKATLKDLSDLVEFQIRMALESENLTLEKPTLTQGIRALFQNPLLGQYYVIENKESAELMGCLLITFEWSDWRNGLVWWIQSVYVAPEFRRSGIFTQLYRGVQNLAMADSSVRGIRLYVETHNNQAVKTYEKMGMDSTRYRVCEWLKEKDAFLGTVLSST